MIKPTVNLKSFNWKKTKVLIWPAFAFLFSYISQINLAIPAFLLAVWIYLNYRRPDIRGAALLNIIFLFLLGFTASYLMLKSRLLLFWLPFSLIAMLAALLFNDLEIVLLLTLGISVSVFASTYNPLLVLTLFIVSGIISGVLLTGCRKRVTVIQAGLIVGLVQLLLLLLMERFWIGWPKRYFALMLNSILSSIIVLGVLPVFEYLFNTVTNISLLELADFNHPILQRMIQEAPGTYHHSLVVGNISESACRAVGANALLARIGAYYHDIGKIEKAGYFSENQDIKISKHDSLSPSMSKMIIMNHVKEGEELAKKYHLNPALVQFIQRHHGNSLVYYFYRKALENLEEDQEIKEEGFRYPGPKPNTKETAIVLLADSAEAATRALKEPSAPKIEEVVHKVINNKFIDGQLDECNLTLKDLEKISAVFIRILTGIYHSRVDYPETVRSENNHKKPAKEDPRQSEKDQKSNS